MYAKRPIMMISGFALFTSMANAAIYTVPADIDSYKQKTDQAVYDIYQNPNSSIAQSITDSTLKTAMGNVDTSLATVRNKTLGASKMGVVGGKTYELGKKGKLYIDGRRLDVAIKSTAQGEPKALVNNATTWSQKYPVSSAMKGLSDPNDYYFSSSTSVSDYAYTACKVIENTLGGYGWMTTNRYMGDYGTGANDSSGSFGNTYYPRYVRSVCVDTIKAKNSFMVKEGHDYGFQIARSWTFHIYAYNDGYIIKRWSPVTEMLVVNQYKAQKLVVGYEDSSSAYGAKIVFKWPHWKTTGLVSSETTDKKVAWNN